MNQGTPAAGLSENRFWVAVCTPRFYTFRERWSWKGCTNGYFVQNGFEEGEKEDAR